MIQAPICSRSFRQAPLHLHRVLKFMMSQTESNDARLAPVRDVWSPRLGQCRITGHYQIRRDHRNILRNGKSKFSRNFCAKVSRSGGNQISPNRRSVSFPKRVCQMGRSIARKRNATAAGKTQTVGLKTVAINRLVRMVLLLA